MRIGTSDGWSVRRIGPPSSGGRAFPSWAGDAVLSPCSARTVISSWASMTVGTVGVFSSVPCAAVVSVTVR